MESVIKLDNPAERVVLKSLNTGRIRKALQGTEIQNANDAAIALLRTPKYQQEFLRVIKANRNKDGLDACNEWLKRLGTNMEDLAAAFAELQMSSILPWTQLYLTTSGDQLQVIGKLSPKRWIV